MKQSKHKWREKQIQKNGEYFIKEGVAHEEHKVARRINRQIPDLCIFWTSSFVELRANTQKRTSAAM
jgi:hypothetical protein